ncbi:MAG TPA: cytochrome c [Candidatus Angelobacter sp.]|nr:cytochrome c [Candidatus Angelobacter sp.]
MSRKAARTYFYALIFAVLNLSTVSSWAQSPAESLFKSKCAACHGADGQGEVPMGKKLGAHNLKSPEVQSRSDAELTAAINKGQNKMPAYGGKLTPDQTNDLIKYIRSLK